MSTTQELGADLRLEEWGGLSFGQIMCVRLLYVQSFV